MDTKSPVVNYPTPPTTSHNFSAFSFNIKSESGNYPYSYSPTLSNCISSTDNYPIVSSNLSSKDNIASPNMNMNNYNGINMYNTTSIISNNDGSSFNNPNGNNNGYGQATGNSYSTSNQAPNNDTYSSFPSYSNINYTNINTSIQPLSPKEISYVDKSQVIVDGSQQNTPQNNIANYDQNSNQSSQQNFVNCNTYSNSDSKPINSNDNMINNNKSAILTKNDQKLTIDTSIARSNNDTPSSILYSNSNGHRDSFDIKTPTSAKSQKSQVNTPPMTPVPEKSKKKRGDHIHYNIKTNMFNETQQYYEIFNFEKTKSYNIRIIPKVDRGFFPTGPENDFTCYRRNYFQISVSFTADNIKSPNEFTTPCLLKFGDDFLTVDNFYVSICAKVKDSNKEIRVVQQTAKREKGPQNKPIPKLCKPGGNPNYYHGLTSNQSIVTFERLQFKSATPNSSKRTGTQQFYALVIELYADTQHKRCKVATIESKRLIVRGRSPGHYINGGFDNISFSNTSFSSSSSTSDPSSNSFYENNNQGYNNGFGNNNYNPNYNNGANITSTPSNQVPVNYNNNYTNEQNMNFMSTTATNNGQFQSNFNSNQSPYAPPYSSQLPYKDNQNGYDNYNSTAATVAANANVAAAAMTGSSYCDDNTGANATAAAGMNYQNNMNVPSNNPSAAAPNSFYPLKDINSASMDSSSQNGYMYQTPPLPPQQTPQSINTNIAYNVSKQEIVSPYSTDGQNTYSPYVQGPMNIFPSQSQPSPASYPSTNNYYPSNPNTNPQVSQVSQVSSPINHQSISQNMNTTNNSPYYAPNNQDLIFSSIPFNQTKSFPNQSTTSNTNPSNNFLITQTPPQPSSNSAVASTTANQATWGSNGTF